MSYRDGIDGEEKRLSVLILQWLGRWLKRVLDAVLGAFRRFGTMPDPHAMYSRAGEWVDIVESRILPEFRTAHKIGWESVLPDTPLISTDSFIQAQIAQTRNLLVRIPDDVYNLIFAEISDAVNDGDPIRDIAARVENALSVTGSENWPNRAKVIAVTEVNRAGNAAAYAAGLQAERIEGVPMIKKWLCLTGDNPVMAAGLKEVARRPYEGQVVRVSTASGRRVTMTPQHPVLTTTGWVAAQSLEFGDQVLCISEVHPVRAPQVYRGQPSIGELVDSTLNLLGPTGGARRVPGSVDFQSNPAVDQYVDVAGIGGDLLPNIEASKLHQLRHLFLELPDMALAFLATEGATPEGLKAGGSFADEVESSGALIPESPTLPGNTNTPRLAAVPESNPRLPKDSGDSGRRGVHLCRDCRDRFASLVELDDVIQVEIVALSGHVYDLSTQSQWFAAGGMVVHNSSDDSRVRPAHRRADGQEQPLGQPFDVGGDRLMFPGDPTGLPEQVISCRCSLLIKEARQ